MNARQSGLAAVLSAALLIAFVPITASAGFKCWTNKDGVRECGNAVPPEYAQQEHREFSEHGITLKETSRAKTDEELRDEREEQARIAAIEAEKERERRERAAHDRVLLYTFTTEEDMMLARDGQLAAIDTRIMHTQQMLHHLEKSLEELRADAAKLERNGKELTPELMGKIDSMQSQIEKSHAFIEERRKYKEEVEAQFEADLDRYRELKGTR